MYEAQLTKFESSITKIQTLDLQQNIKISKLNLLKQIFLYRNLLIFNAIYPLVLQIMLLGLTVLCDLINSEENFALFIAIWSVCLSLLTFHNSPAHEEHQRENHV